MINHYIIDTASDKYNHANTERIMAKHPIRQFVGMPSRSLQHYGKKADINFIAALHMVCLEYSVSPDTLKSKSRLRNTVQARHTLCWLMKKNSNLSLTEIGTLCGGLDHATVLHAVRQIDNYIWIKDHVGITAQIIQTQLT